MSLSNGSVGRGKTFTRVFPSKVIKAIIFDWGGVLIENPARGLMEFCARELGVSVEALQEAFTEQEKSIQSMKRFETESWKRMCTKLKCTPPSEKSLWKRAVENVFKDKPEVWELVKRLRISGYRIGFLSNTEEGAMEYFHERGYDQYFDATIFSCAEGVVKPDARIYEIACEKLGVTADEAVFIDDRPTNIAGAEAVGMHGILFKDIEQVKKELQKFGVKVEV